MADFRDLDEKLRCELFYNKNNERILLELINSGKRRRKDKMALRLLKTGWPIYRKKRLTPISSGRIICATCPPVWIWGQVRPKEGRCPIHTSWKCCLMLQSTCHGEFLPNHHRNYYKNKDHWQEPWIIVWLPRLGWGLKKCIIKFLDYFWL